ncbi:MAG: hypothetical protein Kow00108_09180 [Calditrichia bacterium]
MIPIKSQKGISLLEVLMLLIIVSVATFSVGGIVVNIVNITTKSLLMKKAHAYAQIPVNRVQGFIEECEITSVGSFLQQLEAEFDDLETPDKYKYDVTVDSLINYLPSVATGLTAFDKIYRFNIKVDHDLLPQPVELELDFPAYQNDYSN